MVPKAHEPVVFDHDDDRLSELAREAGLRVLSVAETGDAKDESAARKLMDESWTLALVHILPDPWESLCQKLPEDRVIVRFSTAGFPPIPPAGVKVLALHCIRQVKNLCLEDVRMLAAAFQYREALPDFRRGVIPTSIQHLIAFEEPRRLRALHILLQGVLACWASDPGNPFKDRARSLLGVDSIPPFSNRSMTQLETLWRGLGLEVSTVVTRPSKEAFCAGLAKELGLDELEEGSSIKMLIDQLLDSPANAQMEPCPVLSGFAAIDRRLRQS